MALLLLRNISLHKIPPDFFGILKPTISVIPRSLYTIRLMGTASPRGGHSEESMKLQAQRDFQTEPSCDSPDDYFRREASLAIKGHLCRKWHLSKSDVSRAIEHAPRFVTKMKTLVEATGKVKELKNELNLVKPEVGVYGAAVETLLKEAGTISEVELFLESIGKEEEGTVPAGIELCADRGLVAVTRLLERFEDYLSTCVKQHTINFLENATTSRGAPFCTYGIPIAVWASNSHSKRLAEVVEKVLHDEGLYSNGKEIQFKIWCFIAM